MRTHATTSALIAASALLAGMAGCRSSPGGPAGAEQAGHTPAEIGRAARTRPVFSPGPGYGRDAETAAQLGADSFWNATSDHGGRVILSATRKDAGVPQQLGTYVGYVDRVFTQRVTDRRVHLLELDEGNTGLRLLGEQGVPWVAIAYTRDEHADPSVRGASCDSAALIMDFGDAYWTLSWNATRGTLGERAQEMSAFLESMTIGHEAGASRHGLGGAG